MTRFPRTLVLTACIAAVLAAAPARGAEPSPEEQFMLELVNRARLDPPAEGVRLVNHPDPDIQFAYQFFDVDLPLVESEFAAYPPTPPLAWNEALTLAALRHANDLRDNNFQGHTGTDGSNPGTRALDAGYDYQRVAENVYSYGKSMEHAHAGFLVDWGNDDPGHRKSTLEYHREPSFTDIGLGILPVPGQSGKVSPQDGRALPSGVLPAQTPDVGPWIVVIVFGNPFFPVPKITGAVYADADGNGFYGIGEGLGGATVTVLETGASATVFDSGGYVLETPGPGTYTVEASGGPFSQPVLKTVEMDNDNGKADFVITPMASVPDWMILN